MADYPGQPTILSILQQIAANTAVGNSNGNPVSVISPDVIGAPSASFTRPANATAYAVGQLVANSVTAGLVVPPSWANLVRAAGDSFRIERLRMTVSAGALLNGSFRIYVFNALPTVTVGDGALFDNAGVLAANNIENLAGIFNVTLSNSGSDGAIGWGIPNAGSGVTASPNTGTGIYFLIEAQGAWVPPSGAVISVYAEGYKP